MKALQFSILACVVWAVIGCRGQQVNESGARGGEVVATINSRSLIAADVLRGMEDLVQLKATRDFSEDQKKEILIGLIDTELIFQHALAERFHLRDPEVRKTVVAQYLLTHVTEEHKAGLKEAKEFYQSHQEEIDMIRVRHILVTDSKRSEEQARAKIETVIEELDAGHPFEELVKKASEDKGSTAAGGDLGFISRRTSFVQPFLDGAFALKNIGDRSPPIRTRFGFHIIELTDDRRGFTANQELILARLSLRIQDQAYFKLLSKLKEEASITANFERLTDINLPLIDDSATADGATP